MFFSFVLYKGYKKTQKLFHILYKIFNMEFIKGKN